MDLDDHTALTTLMTHLDAPTITALVNDTATLDHLMTTDGQRLRPDEAALLAKATTSDLLRALTDAMPLLTARIDLHTDMRNALGEALTLLAPYRPDDANAPISEAIAAAPPAIAEKASELLDRAHLLTLAAPTPDILTLAEIEARCAAGTMVETDDGCWRELPEGPWTPFLAGMHTEITTIGEQAQALLDDYLQPGDDEVDDDEQVFARMPEDQAVRARELCLQTGLLIHIRDWAIGKFIDDGDPYPCPRPAS